VKELWAKLIGLKWMNTPGFLAQAGHALLGLLSVVWPFALFQSWIASAIGTGVLTAYMIHKEVTVDPLIEDEGFWPEGAKDIAFAFLGVAIGWGSLWAAGRV